VRHGSTALWLALQYIMKIIDATYWCSSISEINGLVSLAQSIRYLHMSGALGTGLSKSNNQPEMIYFQAP
jgi:hypothetical protein